MNPVIAGNFDQYRNFIGKRRVPVTDAMKMYPYVDTHHKLMGLHHFTTVFLVGTWWQNQNIKQIKDVCKMRGFLAIELEV